MPWIARDHQGNNPYRIFGSKPKKLRMIDYHGEETNSFTWSYPAKKNDVNYRPLVNDENTEIPEEDSPLFLEPGEGPVEVKLSLVEPMPPRTFEGSGI